jgi:hypothetical protein
MRETGNEAANDINATVLVLILIWLIPIACLCCCLPCLYLGLMQQYQAKNQNDKAMNEWAEAVV